MQHHSHCSISGAVQARRDKQSHALLSAVCSRMGTALHVTGTGAVCSRRLGMALFQITEMRARSYRVRELSAQRRSVGALHRKRHPSLHTEIRACSSSQAKAGLCAPSLLLQAASHPEQVRGLHPTESLPRKSNDVGQTSSLSSPGSSGSRQVRLGLQKGTNQAAQATATHTEAKSEISSQLNGKVQLVMAP